MKILRDIYFVGGIILVAFGLWIIRDKWVALFPLILGSWTIYETKFGNWFKK